MAGRLYNYAEWTLQDIHANNKKDAIYRLNHMLNVLHAHTFKQTRRPHKETT